MNIKLAQHIALMTTLASSSNYFPITPRPHNRDVPEIKGITEHDVDRMERAEKKRDRKAAKRLAEI